MSHPGAGAVAQLLEGLDGDGLATLDHLLECRLCRIRLRPVLAERRSQAATLGGLGGGYDRMWERLEVGVLAAVEAQDRDESLAAPLLAELLALPAAERQNAVEEDARFHSWALAGQLLEMGRRAGDADPAIRLERINLALTLADRLEPSEKGEGSAAGLRARAHAYLGESLALAGDRAGAEAAFQHAALHLEGSVDPLDRAWYCHLLSRMRAEEGRRDEATALAGRAAFLFTWVGQVPEAVTAILDEIRLLLELAEPDLAREPLYRLVHMARLDLLTPEPSEALAPELAPVLARLAAAVEADAVGTDLLGQILAVLGRGSRSGEP
jgi:tetratricopeptide (TPR) repeat protein